MLRLGRSFLQQLKAKEKQMRISTLKKSSGYSLGQCRKALEENDYDIEMANEYLAEEAKKQGWSKMSSLSGRNAADGFVAITENETHLTMFEVNCETDFVAKTDPFKRLVTAIGEKYLDIQKAEPDSEAIKSIIAPYIYTINENIITPRALLFDKRDREIGCYIHNPIEISKGIAGGRFGSVVIGRNGTEPNTLSDIAKLCVASFPTSLGKWNEKRFQMLKMAEDITPEDKYLKVTPINTQEKRLLYQEHLIKGTYCVGYYLAQSAAKVDSFHRYELGEMKKNEDMTDDERIQHLIKTAKAQ